MTTSREYRQFASECTKWAAEASTDETRKSFLDLAADWLFAATVTGRIEKQETPALPTPQSSRPRPPFPAADL
jgi:hypothetical protein